MRNHIGTVLGLLFVAAPVLGQTLQERVQAVQEQNRQPAPLRQLTPTEQILQKLYYTDITVGFEEATAREAFEFLAELLEITIVGRYEDDPQGFGMDPNALITLDARDTRALDVLELMLEQCVLVDPCTWQLRGSFLEVGTRERLAMASAQQTRAYPIDELLFQPEQFHDAPSLDLRDQLINSRGIGYRYDYLPYGYPGGAYGGYRRLQYGGGAMVSGGGQARADSATKKARAQELIELIEEMIEPDMWADNGGTGATIRYYDGALVVRAPDFIHRQLAGYPKVPPPARDE